MEPGDESKTMHCTGSVSLITCIEHDVTLCIFIYSFTDHFSGRYGDQDQSHAISVVQWYPHDTGIFTTSSVDRLMKIWDTNAMRVVEKFKFSSAIYAHSIASAGSHCLIAGESALHCVTPMCYNFSRWNTIIILNHI